MCHRVLRPRQYARHERSHRHLMRLHHLSDDRCAAIRQNQHCVAALREVLEVAPDARTQALYLQIAGDALGPTFSEFNEAPPEAALTLTPILTPSQLAELVRSLRARLAAVERRVGLA